MKKAFLQHPLLLASISTLALSGCFGGSSSSSSSSPTSPSPGGQTDTVRIEGLRTLSNDPALVSNGNVLVEVQLAGTQHDQVVVELNGQDVSNTFAKRSDGRFVGLVDGLAVGSNTLIAFAKGDRAARAELGVTNHPASGPIFSGPHLTPWICAQPSARSVTVVNPRNGQEATAEARASQLSAPDADCNIPREVSYFYQPTDAGQDCAFQVSGENACFKPYDPANPPADGDIARFTNDRGDNVRSILAVERGALNRGLYSLSVFHDPEQPHHPADPQKGWNNKLIFSFGGSSGGSRFQSQPATGPFFNEQALRAGYMLATSSLNDHGTNANHALGAEALMMLKEHIVETYGPIRYTVGTGGSGGAIVQLTMASSYPGLLDGLIPSVTYADALTNGIEISDCGIFNATNGYISGVPADERNALTVAYTGHSSPFHCSTWNAAFLPSGNPANATNCGAGFPASLVYHPTDNPNGIRCAHPEHNINLLGSRADADGVVRANQPLDNVGVQYGLLALQNGTITPERFVHLNENIGHYDLDQQRLAGPTRRSTSQESLERAYRSGMVTDGRYLANVPIIDIRYNEPAVDIHLNWRAKSVRDRLQKANGHHDNQVIWAYQQSQVQAPATEAFRTMDAWLTAIEADQSSDTLARKVVTNKPQGVTDQCLIRNGAGEVQNVGLDNAACPVKFGKSPRQVAGGPVAEDILKCQLRPITFDSPDYRLAATGEQIVFTPDQQTRLQQVFSTGVCDWSKAGVGQELNPGWMSFAEGPDAVPLDLTWFDRP